MKLKSVDSPQHGAKSICSLRLFNELDLRWFFLCVHWKLNAFLRANALISPNKAPLLLGTALCCFAIHASLHCGCVVDTLCYAPPSMYQHCHQHWCMVLNTSNVKADCTIGRISPQSNVGFHAPICFWSAHSSLLFRV